MNPTPHITRKELATLLDVSTDIVRKNEDRWGIADYRANFNDRLVKYFRARTLAKLRLLKLID